MRKFLICAFLTFLCCANFLSAQFVYEEKPKDFDPTMEVAACFIRAKDQVLFLKRLPNKPQGNTWGIPGGKFDEGETADETVIREIREETGIEIPKESMTYIGEFYVRYPENDFKFHIFEYELETLPEVHYNPNEHAGYCWVTLEEALQMPLIPGEDECIYLTYGDVKTSSLESTG